MNFKVRTTQDGPGRYRVLALIPKPGQKRGNYRDIGYVEAMDDGGWAASHIVDGVQTRIDQLFPRKRDAVSELAERESYEQHAQEPKAGVDSYAGYDPVAEGDATAEEAAGESDGDSTFMEDVARGAAFDNWLSKVDVRRTSLWEAWKAGAEWYASGARHPRPREQS